MESYSEFMNRISSFERPQLGIDFDNFRPSNSVLQKVDENNGFSPFYGDTVVFELDSVDKRAVDAIIDQLYGRVDNCFCEKLNMATLHMTLHDLTNSANQDEILSQMFKNQSAIMQMVMRDQIKSETILMKSNYIINMVNTSLVLCFYPADEKEYEKLMRLYSLMDEVVSLPYPFTPHITLAYFNRYGFDRKAAFELGSVVEELNKHQFEIILSTERLHYQRFASMNDYSNVLRLVQC